MEACVAHSRCTLLSEGHPLIKWSSKPVSTEYALWCLGLSADLFLWAEMDNYEIVNRGRNEKITIFQFHLASHEKIKQHIRGSRAQNLTMKVIAVGTWKCPWYKWLQGSTETHRGMAGYEI